MSFARNLQERQERREAEKAAHMAGLMSKSVSVSTSVYGGSVAGPQAKSRQHRNPMLLRLAMNKPCLLNIPEVCTGAWATVVACHSNLSIHGKAGARKANDEYTVWGCSACHTWLDQGPASAEKKSAAFQQAHARQVEKWREIAANRNSTVPAARAAAWALERIGEKL